MTSSADSKGHNRSAQKTAAIMVGFFGHIFLSRWMQIGVAARGMEIRAHFAPVTLGSQSWRMLLSPGSPSPSLLLILISAFFRWAASTWQQAVDQTRAKAGT